MRIDIFSILKFESFSGLNGEFIDNKEASVV